MGWLDRNIVATKFDVGWLYRYIIFSLLTKFVVGVISWHYIVTPNQYGSNHVVTLYFHPAQNLVGGGGVIIVTFFFSFFHSPTILWWGRLCFVIISSDFPPELVLVWWGDYIMLYIVTPAPLSANEIIWPCRMKYQSFISNIYSPHETCR